MYGEGLSANVRSAYGFLAHNYAPGDKMYFFGFSRGAYTTRSIAGLVAYLGLLSKRGMDSFPEIYDEYYNNLGKKPSPELAPGLKDTLVQNGDLHPDAGDDIEIIGVWDTVGFHGEFGGEKIEFYNTILSPKVSHGYHALALDETRLAFEPILWQIPDPPNPNQEMIQVWFSGVHTDVGGGYLDHHLSDISLMWMIAQCAKDNKLQFDDEGYLGDKKDPGTTWDTSLGEGKGNSSSGFTRVSDMIKHLVEGKYLGPRKPKKLDNTNEEIHLSIHDRDLSRWPCGPLSGLHGMTEWMVKANDTLLKDSEVDAGGIELKYRGRVRPCVPVKPS